VKSDWTRQKRAVMIDGVSDEQRGVAAPGIRHVLFDADGVLQNLPGGWIAAAEPYFGERALEFLERAYAAELPTLAGQGDHLAILGVMLAEFGVTVPVGDVHRAIWLSMEPAAASLAVVHALRRGGYGVHLGTNQERYRAAHMREVLGYDALFDVSCYSCDLGVAKPDPGFFAAAARRIGAGPAGILFVDDSARNVEGARAAGLAAEEWELGQGRDALLALLARHGVIADLGEPV
jgi:putative hydrolase of the HAD superfamily